MYIRPEVTPEYIEINEISFIDYVFTGTFFKTASLFDRPVLFGGITILFMGILHVLNSVGECIYDLRFKKKK